MFFDQASVNGGGFPALWFPCRSAKIRDRKGTPKNLCDKDFAEVSGELSGAICPKTLVLLGSALKLFRKFFGLFVRFFGFGVLFWPSTKAGVLIKRGFQKRHLVVLVVLVVSFEMLQSCIKEGGSK